MVQNSKLGLFSNTFSASSRKLSCVWVSRFLARTFSRVYTLTHTPPRSFTTPSSLAHSAAAHCGAVAVVGSVRARDLYTNDAGADEDVSAYK